MSPDVKNSIHVGDRILEINGTPIRNVPLDEVGKGPVTSSGGRVVFTLSSLPHCHGHLTCAPVSQIDLLIQETSRLLQLTIEHDPHDSLGQGLPSIHSPLGSPACTPSGEVVSTRQKPVL